MKTLNKVFTEEQVNEVSEKILKSSIEKINNDLNSRFYDEMKSFLYEHYQNVSDSIHKELIKEITEEFIKDPLLYKFAGLRQKLFNENKDLLIKTLTDEAIEKNVEDVIWQHTNQNYQFDWKWKNAIIRIILENWNKLKDDERINNGLLREIEQLKHRLNNIKEVDLEVTQTVIQDALYATNHYSTDDCDNLAIEILMYFKDAGFMIVKQF